MRPLAPSFRTLCLLASILTVLTLAIRTAHAQNKIAVHVALAGAPGPAAVSGAPNSARLAAWIDFHDLLPSGTPPAKSSWSWHLLNVEYSPDGQSFAKPAPAQSHSAAFADPASSETTLRFQGPPGYWRLTCNASVSRTDAAGKTSTGTSDDKAITFIVVSAQITVWNDALNHGQGDWGPTAEIAAGAIDSRVHQTDVFLTVSPAVAAEVPLSLLGGVGHPADAQLRIGGKTLGPNETVPVLTDPTGHLIGVLTSSDSFDGKPVTVSGGGGTAAITFGWDNYQGPDGWQQHPPYFIAGGSSFLEVRFAHNGRAMDGHKALFVVERVDYTDDDGKPQTLFNTPDHPQDLKEWASFDEPDHPTDGTGTVYAKVYYTLKCTRATNVQLTVYDMNVYKP